MTRVPRTLLGGRLRTTTAALVVTFLAVLALYLAVRPPPVLSVRDDGTVPAVLVPQPSRAAEPSRVPPTTPTPTPAPPPATPPTAPPTPAPAGGSPVPRATVDAPDEPSPSPSGPAPSAPAPGASQVAPSPAVSAAVEEPTPAPG